MLIQGSTDSLTNWQKGCLCSPIEINSSLLNLVLWHTSKGTIVMSIPDSKTLAAASGSAQTLNSAAGVIFPGTLAAPAIIVIFFIFFFRSGVNSKAFATLVKGPMVTNSISFGLSLQVEEIKDGASIFSLSIVNKGVICSIFSLCPNHLLSLLLSSSKVPGIPLWMGISFFNSWSK